MNLLNKKELFNTTDYVNVGTTGGFVEHWDFSEANKSHENRVKAVSQVASVCYGNDSLELNFKLYNKLARESIGLPSSSFEFIPVLLDANKTGYIMDAWIKSSLVDTPNIFRYGYTISDDYAITNLRALINDITTIDLTEHPIEDEIWYNTSEKEIEIIKNNFKVFRIKATIRDFRQHERHRRASYQELSRRYTTGNKVPLEFRFNSSVGNKGVFHAMNSIKLYFDLLNEGIKAEEARDVLPVSLYSTVWTSYYPDGLSNYIKLRTKPSAQKEIKQIANTIELFVKGEINAGN